jgi:hypothetical protein
MCQAWTRKGWEGEQRQCMHCLGIMVWTLGYARPRGLLEGLMHLQDHHHHVTQSSHSINAIGPAPLWSGRKREHCSIMFATITHIPSLHKIPSYTPRNHPAPPPTTPNIIRHKTQQLGRSIRLYISCYSINPHVLPHIAAFVCLIQQTEKKSHRVKVTLDYSGIRLMQLDPG